MEPPAASVDVAAWAGVVELEMAAARPTGHPGSCRIPLYSRTATMCNVNGRQRTAAITAARSSGRGVTARSTEFWYEVGDKETKVPAKQTDLARIPPPNRGGRRSGRPLVMLSAAPDLRVHV